MAYVSYLMERQLHGGPVNKRPFIKDFTCTQGQAGSGTITSNALSGYRTSPIFSLQYGSHYIKMLAACDEDGMVSIINTNKVLPEDLNNDAIPIRTAARWYAHRNAVFDIKWANNDAWMYTGSGDMSVGLWDTNYALQIASFRGHGGSVKCVAVSPQSPVLTASGSLDGNIFIWDCREHARTILPNDHNGRPHFVASSCSPVLRLYKPHGDGSAEIPSREKPLVRPSIPGITALEFLRCGNIMVSGSVQGIVKFWDVRYAAGPLSDINNKYISSTHATTGVMRDRANDNSRVKEITETPKLNLGRRQHAVTSISLRPDHSQIMVSLTGGHHLLYNSSCPDAGPSKWFGGHQASSMYVKGAFSPDGTHFMSGSSDERVCIWQVDGTQATPDGCAQPVSLLGHEQEVTAVAWCPTDFLQIATASDDCTIKVWQVERNQPEEQKHHPEHFRNKYQWVRDITNTYKACHETLTGTLPKPTEKNVVSNKPLDKTVDRAPLDPTRPQGDAAKKTIRISNALKESLLLGNNKKKRKTKQQTLAEVFDNNANKKMVSQSSLDSPSHDGSHGNGNSVNSNTKRPRTTTASGVCSGGEEHNYRNC